MRSKRLDLWLAEKYFPLTRSYFKSLIEGGGVSVNGRLEKKRYCVEEGDRVDVQLRPPLQNAPLLPENIPLDVLYEDAEIILIDKPIGLVVHPGAGNWSGTFANALLHHCSHLAAGDAHRPGIVHRLDKQTSGLLLAAKTDSAHRHLSAQFANRSVAKSYLTLTCRKPKGLKAEFPIARDTKHRKRMAISPFGKQAVTDFRILQQVAAYCLIEARPLTGRTHQIRLHLSALGSPIAGDSLYGGRPPASTPLNHPLLHAWKIGFEHPRTNAAMSFSAPLPAKFQSILQLLHFCDLPPEIAALSAR